MSILVNHVGVALSPFIHPYMSHSIDVTCNGKNAAGGGLDLFLFEPEHVWMPKIYILLIAIYNERSPIGCPDLGRPYLMVCFRPAWSLPTWTRCMLVFLCSFLYWFLLVFFYFFLFFFYFLFSFSYILCFLVSFFYFLSPFSFYVLFFILFIFMVCIIWIYFNTRWVFFECIANIPEIDHEHFLIHDNLFF